MIYKFSALIYAESGRAFINIPFSVWEETGLKGNIPCRVSIRDISFECKLIPKGRGKYVIPISKKILSSLTLEEEYEVGMEPIQTLSRINHDSPYSKEKSIRYIDRIEIIPIQAGFCGHCCVAMLAGVSDVDPKKTISYIEVFTENKKKKSREDYIYEELGEIRDTINDKKIEAFKRLEASRQQSEGRFDYEKEREEGINAKYGL